MKVIDINFKNLQKEIYIYTEAKAGQKPIILMSIKTADFIKSEYTDFTHYLKDYDTLLGCYVAIANWLDFGEVELR